jgi:hypothetical protein
MIICGQQHHFACIAAPSEHSCFLDAASHRAAVVLSNRKCLVLLTHMCVHASWATSHPVCRWGSSFSNKYFLEKRFVVKHILNKHQDKLDAHK